MANEEHLAILKEGVVAWNRWKMEQGSVRPDLSGADLSRADLTEANLSGADLTEANVSRANLTEAVLPGANLTKSNLTNTTLAGAHLYAANLSVARLTRANFNDADLRDANLSGAFLSNAHLRGAFLRGADLSNAGLSNADLSDASAIRANFSGATVTGANLRRADLSGANLSRANLSELCLISAKLDRATLTGARLWETQRAGWSIEGVICEYAFWDAKGEIRTDYASGEFERLHSSSRVIELTYEGGASRIEVDTLPMLVRELERRHDGVQLRLKALAEAPGGSKATIAIEESGEQDIATLQEEAQELQGLVRVKKEVIALQSKLDVYQLEFRQLLLEAKMGTTINIGGDVHGNVVGEAKDSATVSYTANQLDGIQSLVTELMQRRGEWEQAAGDQAASVDAAISDVERETKTDKPNPSKLQGALNTIKTVLDSVDVAFDVGQKIAQYLPLA